MTVHSLTFPVQISSINEESAGAQPSVGRLMNHHAELMTWRDDLPLHLRFDKTTMGVDADRIEGIAWVKRQRQSVQVRKSSVAPVWK